MKKSLILLLVLSAVGACWAFDGQAPVAVAPELLTSLWESRLGRVDSLTVTPDGKRLWSIQGELSEPLAGDLPTAVQEFVSTHARLFNLPRTSDEGLLQIVRQEQAAGGYHFALQPMVEGHLVQEALIEIHLDGRRRVCMAHGSLPDIMSIANVRRLSPAEAIERGKRAVGARALYAAPGARPVLYPSAPEGPLVWAYVVNIPSRQPLGHFRLILDAETGAEYDRTDDLLFAVEGRGNVYRHHPLATPLTVEPLRYLASTTLTGLFTRIVNPKSPVADRPDGAFFFDPADTHFDEVNVYFHINAIHDFFAAMGFNRLDRPIPAVVHYGDKLDNAVFDAGFGVLGFGDGDLYHSFAREESIIYHEYSHAVLNEIVKLRNAGESGAMNEGQADYFGSSLSNDPLHGEYVAAKAGLPYIRTLLNQFHYPDDIVGAVHKDGRIWSGALWDLRVAVGPEVADLLLHASHFYLKAGAPTFRDGFNALLTADMNLFGGKYKSALNGVMSRRGISTASYRRTVLGARELQTMRVFRAVHGQ